jgi:uncharacterized protein (TIGR02246 family)
VATVLSALALTACFGPPAATQPFGKGDIGSINKVIEELRAAYNAKDPAKAATLFTGDAVVMPPNAPTMRGNESVRQYYVNRFASGATDLELTPQDVSGAGMIAYASGEYRLRIVPPGGDPERPDRGKFLWIFRNLGGRWLIQYVMFSSDFAPPGV